MKDNEESKNLYPISIEMVKRPKFTSKNLSDLSPFDTYHTPMIKIAKS